jgi:hypothetical protein
MTVIIQPDWKLVMTTIPFTYKVTVAKKLRDVASSVLNLTPESIDIRDVTPGGSAVTSASSGLAVQDTGAAVDIVLNTFAAADIGWEIAAASITAFSLSSFLNTAVQARSTRGKVFAIFGAFDLTTAGDLVNLRFASGQNVRAYLQVQPIYETTMNELVGCHFVDDKTNLAAAIFFGLTI